VTIDLGGRAAAGRHRPRACLAVAATALLAACGSGVPVPRFPQVEQVSEAVQGDRLRHHQTCASTAKGFEPMVDCMRDAGYEFLPRGPEYPASECWRMRDASDRQDRLPEPFCFLKRR